MYFPHARLGQEVNEERIWWSMSGHVSNFRQKVDHREAYVSAEQSSPQEEAWLSQPDEDRTRTCRAGPAPSQGPQASVRLIRTDSSERWRASDRMCRRQDFVRCYRRGRRRYGKQATVYIHPNEESCPRFGTTASRKVGKSVVRHRLKRWVREIVRRYSDRERLPAVDVVFHLSREAGTTSFESFRREVLGHLDRLVASPR